MARLATLPRPPAPPPIRERVFALILPSFLLYYAVRSFISILLETLLHQNRKISEIRGDAFAKFWNLISGPSDPNSTAIDSASLIPPLLSTASGTVLELGPGNGTQVEFFDPKRVHIIYGAEPAIALHETLQDSANKAGLDGQYIIVAAEPEAESIVPALAKAGAFASQSGSVSEVFDAIVLVRVLCSVPNQAETIRTLYALLKPGGRLLVCEHVINPWRAPLGSITARAMQTVYMMLGWKYFVGECELTRDTSRVLVDAVGKQGWKEVKLQHYFTWAPLCYVAGTLTKAG